MWIACSTPASPHTTQTKMLTATQQLVVASASKAVHTARTATLLSALLQRCCYTTSSHTSGSSSGAGSNVPAATAIQQQQQHSKGPGSVLKRRYADMLSAGVLRPDQHQQQLIEQLATLLQQLQAYSGQLVQYRAARAAYEDKYQHRLRELEQRDQQQQQQEQEQQHQQQQQPQQQQVSPAAAGANPPTSSDDSGWFSKLLDTFSISSSSSTQQATEKQLTPQQKARRAAAARQAQAKQELGGPPVPPAAPQGLYIYGSVGSGKSLIADMFYDTARQELQLDHSRRIHFNAAMLELNSRLHHLDVQRERRRNRRLALAAAASTTQHAVSSSSSAGSPSTPLDGAAATAAAAGVQEEHTEEHEDEHEEEGCADDAASDKQVSAWFDDAQWQQKEAKAAVLAIRRHLRATRAGRVPVARLAAANASVMSAAARSFIRASGPDPASGWEHGVGSSSSSSSGDRLAALLCFDEMQVGDVFSAAALKALLEALTAEGCVVVTTSNRHPADLPRHGLHEAMFGHFLNTLFSSCRLFELSATTDYRRLSLSSTATQLLQQPLLPPPATATAATSSSSPASSNSSSSASRRYLWPLGPAADAAMHQLWAQHAHSDGSSSSFGGSSSTSTSSNITSTSDGSDSSSSVVVPVMFGRTLSVPRAAGGAAWFDFEDLCGKPLGSADYLALAQHYHTLFLSGVPAMSFANRDKARRFISLVDELYNGRVALVCSAALPPDQLFSDGAGEAPLLDLEGLQFEGAVEGSKLRTDLMSDGGVAPVASTTTAAAEAAALLGGAEERFAFARAVSRLYEMQSPLFLAARPRQ